MSTVCSTELIVTGYVRNVEKLLPYNTPYYHMPTPIRDMTVSYIKNYFTNNGKHKWQIDDSQKIKHMLTAKVGDKFESKPFKMARLNWRLEVYPNGDTQQNKGYLVIYLRLLSLPDIINKIVYCRVFRIIENSSSAPWIYTLSKNENDFWSKKCALSELINMQCQTITIEVELFINKIILKEKISNQLKLNERDNYTTIPMTQHMEYKICGSEMIAFKNSINRKSMCSEIMINNMWYIECTPNGLDKEDEGYVGIFLFLCKLPPKIIQLKVEYIVYCMETGNREYIQWMYMDGEFSMGPNRFMKFDQVKTLNQLTFIIDLNILHIQYEKESNDALEIKDESLITNILTM